MLMKILLSEVTYNLPIGLTSKYDVEPVRLRGFILTASENSFLCVLTGLQQKLLTTCDFLARLDPYIGGRT